MKSERCILKSIFDKYCVSGVPFSSENKKYLTVVEFKKIIVDFSKYNKNISVINDENVSAVFMLYDKSGNGKMTLDDFIEWWIDDDSRKYFSKDKLVNLTKAYRLYQRYCNPEGKMDIPLFLRMLKFMKINFNDAFVSKIDKDSDGNITFSEFCEWLDWF